MKTKFLISIIETVKSFSKSVFNFKKTSKNTSEYPLIQIQVEKPEEVETVSVKMNETEQFCQLKIYLLPFKYFELSDNIHSQEQVPQVSHGEILSYYQPESGLFWSDFKPRVNNSWKEQVKDTFFSSDGKVFLYLSDHQIVRFSIQVETRLLIRESHMRYQSIFEAYKRVISVIENNKKELIEGYFSKWYSRLPLSGRYIDRNFFYPETVKFNPFDSADHCIPSIVKIINVTRQQDCWKIELEGNHHRQAQLILRNKQENQEEPVLLRDYCHRRFPNPSKKKQGSLLRYKDYEVLEVWVDGIKKEIP